MLSPAILSELHAALLQATITLGLAALSAILYKQYHKRYLLWWSVAWLLYVFRIGAISGFLASGHGAWLYAHQVLTGWTALALLWTALVLSQQLRWRPWYLALVLFPPIWSYIAIYRLKEFLLAAGPAVLFLSAATLWTGWVFFQYWRRVHSEGAALLSGALFLWGIHHLDYPLLRAKGAWNPWGYYLDILFVLVTGVGILALVLEDLHRGLATLSALSGDLQRGSRGAEGDALDALLARPFALPGVRGSAMYVTESYSGRFVRGIGACASWTGMEPIGTARALIVGAVARGRPEVTHELEIATSSSLQPHAYAAVLPVFRGSSTSGALVIVGDERDPFTALGDNFLLALGHQVGAALEHADLYRRLEARTTELERLSARMVQQHEEERRQISLELHDETAQVFSAVKLQLGLLRESGSPETATRLDRVLTLVDAGIRSIRSVTSDLRPPLLDDLGLLPALRALVADFRERSALDVAFDAPHALPPLRRDAELALFRALQEALSNVARHAAARSVTVRVAVTDDGAIALTVRDDGRGLRGGVDSYARNGHMGLAGMRERLGALGGALEVRTVTTGGVDLRVRLPVTEAAAR